MIKCYRLRRVGIASARRDKCLHSAYLLWRRVTPYQVPLRRRAAAARLVAVFAHRLYAAGTNTVRGSGTIIELTNEWGLVTVPAHQPGGQMTRDHKSWPHPVAGGDPEFLTVDARNNLDFLTLHAQNAS